MLVRKEALPGRRPYLALWLAGFIFWLGAIHWLRLPHPATSLGWLALSFYLAFYVPVFVGLTRAAVHRLNLPLLLAAPVAWTGLELAKGHLLTGFSMGLLGHTQVRWIDLIQVADFGGAYAVSFTLMFVAACVARMFPCEEQRRALWPPLPAGTLLAAVLVYGHFAQSGVRTSPGPKVALIQGSIDTTMKADPSEVSQIHEQYIGLTRDALVAQPDLDLIVWPETMCRASLVDSRPSTGSSMKYAEQAAASRRELHQFCQAAGKRMLLGVDTYEYGEKGVTRYNSAVWIDPNQGVLARYDKMHPVMFGEYVPFADRFPFLYRLTPLGSGIGAGEHLPAFNLPKEGFHGISTRLSANICFESAVPHLIRGQVAQLRAEGQEPQILVNLTNDGWFWGSSELDMHLACGVFRAVEMRKLALLLPMSCSIPARVFIRCTVTYSPASVLPSVSFSRWPASGRE
jgi:apolipoprotein N-acyltransferase